MVAAVASNVANFGLDIVLMFGLGCANRATLCAAALPCCTNTADFELIIGDGDKDLFPG